MPATIVSRDAADSGREIAPAVPADDAVILDNSGMGLDETVECIAKMAKEKMNG